MQAKILERYFFFGLLLITLIFTFLILRPFWAVLVLGICFAVVLHPLFNWFVNKKTPPWLSSLLTTMLFALVLCGPLLAIGLMVFDETQVVYNNTIQNGGSDVFIDKVNAAIEQVLPAGISFDLGSKMQELMSYVSENVAKIFSATFSAFFSFILMLLIMFYFLKDGDKWRKAIIVLSPLGDKDDEKIIDRLVLAINAVIKGYLLIAIIQGVLLGAGLWVFGVPNATLWGVVAGICSLLPTFGTSIVSIPAILFLFSTGQSAEAIGLIAWAAVVVGMIDNVLTPFIVGNKTNIPPLMVLFSVLGGISFLGPIGVVMGPLTVSFLYTLISIYRNEFSQTTTP